MYEPFQRPLRILGEGQRHEESFKKRYGISPAVPAQPLLPQKLVETLNFFRNALSGHTEQANYATKDASKNGAGVVDKVFFKTVRYFFRN